jgi:hypothetical protein
VLCAVFHQLSNQPSRFGLLLRILAIEDNAHDVIWIALENKLLGSHGELTHLSHSNSEGTDKVQFSFRKPLLSDLVLKRSVFARDFRNRREE